MVGPATFSLSLSACSGHARMADARWCAVFSGCCYFAGSFRVAAAARSVPKKAVADVSPHAVRTALARTHATSATCHCQTNFRALGTAGKRARSCRTVALV
jgi:hypothetical protein